MRAQRRWLHVVAALLLVGVSALPGGATIALAQQAEEEGTGAAPAATTNQVEDSDSTNPILT
jgi:hypothetical protein